LFQLFNGRAAFLIISTVEVDIHATNIVDHADSAVQGFFGGTRAAPETIVEAFCTRWVPKEIQSG
jgi:hypothetical protein